MGDNNSSSSSSRMLPAKNNQRGKHPDLICRFCKKEEETKNTSLTTETLHTSNSTKIKTTELFAEFSENTKTIATKLLTIMDKIDELEGNIPNKVNKYPCTKCMKQCRNGQNCIECDTCKKWTHQKCSNLTMQEFSEHCKDTNAKWECNTCNPQQIPTIATTQQQNATRQPTIITIRLSRNTQGEWNILQPQPKTPKGEKTIKRQKPAGRKTQATPATATSTRAGRQPKPRDRLNL